MTLWFDTLPCPDSRLRRLDPRWKLAAFLLAICAVALLRTVPGAVVGFGGALALAGLARLPGRWFAARLGAVAALLILFGALPPFLIRDEASSRALGPVTMSLLGARVALLLCLNGLTVVTIALVVLATASFTANVQAARALHVPGLLVQLALLTYRYLFVLSAELDRLRIALRVRGYRNRASRHSYRTVARVAGTLLVRSYERAERVSQAMRCRGFAGQWHSLTPFHTTTADVCFFLGVVGSAAALVASERILL
jgi:cobalt/nickel transport system permease protein